MQKILKVLFIVVLSFSFSPNLMAQVATPDLDPTVPSSMSMAAGWRFDSVVAGIYSRDETDIKNDSGTNTSEGSLEQSIPDAFVALKLGVLVVEYLGEGKKEWSFSSDDASTDYEELNQKITSSHASLSLLIDGYATIGVGLKQTDVVTHYLKSTATVRDETITMKETAMDYGISFRFSQSVFFSYGQTLHKRESNSRDDLLSVSKDYDVLEWTSQTGGVGFVIGGKAGFFRGEVAIELSPEVSSAGSGTTLSTYQREYQNISGTAQFLFKNLILTYSRETKTVKAIQDSILGVQDDKDQEELKQKYGLGWTLFNQINLSAYSSTIEIDSHNGNSEKQQSYEFHVGVSF